MGATGRHTLRIAERVVAGAIALGTLGGFAWFAWWQQSTDVPAVPAPSALEVPRPASSPAVGRPLYRCDARTQCQQMKSCEEAMFFLQNCKGNKLELDEDDDGIPCEIQWCQR